MKVGVLGAGIAGLAAGWVLAQNNVDVTVFERQAFVGGMARSFKWNNFTCDFATHRLFTQDENVLRQLLTLVPMSRHTRVSQLYLQKKWVKDPLDIIQILTSYSLQNTAELIISYLTRPRIDSPTSFDEFVNTKYGEKLNQFCLQPYTEKMFGIPGYEISVLWAEKKVRIANPISKLLPSSKKHFGYFYYPIEGGYGAIVNQLYNELKSSVLLNASVEALHKTDDRITGVTYSHDGEMKYQEFDVIISTLPLTILGKMLDLDFPLRYRKVRAVYLLVNKPSVSNNHWVYYIDRDVVINRMVEFKNLSPVGTPENQTVLCAEVTTECENITERVIEDVVESGLVRREEVIDSLVLTDDFGYPVYDKDYESVVTQAKTLLEDFKNLYFVGRSAEFEHREVDDSFSSAITVSKKIINDFKVKKRDLYMNQKMIDNFPLVYVVVLTYNNVDDTRECLTSLKQMEYENFEILIVDNGSTDNTPAIVRKEFPDVLVIETGQNLGVPWGYNVGFSHALKQKAEYLFMLNNDTVVAPDILDKLLCTAGKYPEAGVVMPKVLYYDDPKLIWAAGSRYRIFPPAIVMLGQNKLDNDFNEIIDLEYAISCGLLISRETFERVGLFDPGYFFQFDDWDFSVRVREKGFKIKFSPEARMWHKVSKSTRSNSELFYRVWGESSVRYFRRHGNPPFLSVLMHVGYMIARELILGNGKMIKYFWQGVRSGLTKPLGPFPFADDVTMSFDQ